ncbi:MAG: aminotransferase class V-fold PLP-dependent enzyme [Myxococcales bacterium]|nr:aminotransferase class V-fold PLP-dependent enzyme [Myxococcales bacterium]
MIAAAAADTAARGLDAFGAWMAQRQRLKARLAGLLGAVADDLALVPNTTTGLNMIALCLDWRPGDRVVVFEGEFPTNVTPWQRAAKHFDLRLVTLPIAPFAWPDGADFSLLDAALREGVRLVAISAVEFQTGLRVPLDALATRCHAAGAELCVDGIQAVGAVPLDARTVDYLACSGHKWLMGPEGAGFVYCHPDRVKALKPRVAGWLSHESPVDFLFEAGCLRYDKPIRQRIDFLEVGTTNQIGYAGLEGAVALIEQLGVASIWRYAQAWIDPLEAALVKRGFTSLRCPDAARRSALLSLRPPAGLKASTLAAALLERGVHTTTPDGHLRFAPHWPNALTEVPFVVDAIDDALAALNG